MPKISVRTATEKAARGKCALCGEQRKLHQSHIIPEFMFGPLYDQKHRFYSVSSVPSKPNRLLQKGPREKLLCGECEKQFSRYENYASTVFFGSVPTPPLRLPTGFIFRGLDYKKLKLFFMSLIWRLGVTSNDHFAGANLGPHQEHLRYLLLSDDPGDFLRYPAMVIALVQQSRHIPDLIIRPFQTRIDGRRVYAVVITGFLFHFFVSNQDPPKNIVGGFLQRNGDFPLHVTEIDKVRYLKEWGDKIATAEAARALKRSH
jgi:hypothetical protein